MNKAKLENLNEKASLMFKHIEDIQKLVFQKCDNMDEMMSVAEEKFKLELNKAIKCQKQIKEEEGKSIMRNNLRKRGRQEGNSQSPSKYKFNKHA